MTIKIVIILLILIAMFYFNIYLKWEYKKKLTFKLVFTYLTSAVLILQFIILFGIIFKIYEEEKDRTLAERAARVELYLNRGDYSALAGHMELNGNYEPEFEYIWERMEIYECSHRYLVFASAEKNGRNDNAYAEYTLKYKNMLLSLCQDPDYQENTRYGEYCLKQAGLEKQ